MKAKYRIQFFGKHPSFLIPDFYNFARKNKLVIGIEIFGGPDHEGQQLIKVAEFSKQYPNVYMVLDREFLDYPNAARFVFAAGSLVTDWNLDWCYPSLQDLRVSDILLPQDITVDYSHADGFWLCAQFSFPYKGEETVLQAVFCTQGGFEDIKAYVPVTANFEAFLDLNRETLYRTAILHANPLPDCYLRWNGEDNYCFYETSGGNVAGSVEEKDAGFEAGIAVPYMVHANGDEQDWQPANTLFKDLDEAKNWVFENVSYILGGRYQLEFNGIAHIARKT